MNPILAFGIAAGLVVAMLPQGSLTAVAAQGTREAATAQKYVAQENHSAAYLKKGKGMKGVKANPAKEPASGTPPSGKFIIRKLPGRAK